MRTVLCWLRGSIHSPPVQPPPRGGPEPSGARGPVLFRKLDTFTSHSTPTASRPRTFWGQRWKRETISWRKTTRISTLRWNSQQVSNFLIFVSITTVSPSSYDSHIIPQTFWFRPDFSDLLALFFQIWRFFGSQIRTYMHIRFRNGKLHFWKL